MIGDTRLGPFTVDQKIGEGGMGAVYRGTHLETDVPVAIKVIHREAGRGARDRFHEEVQAHAGLVHPGIVYLFEYGQVDESAAEGAGLEPGSPFVAMELADRGTVRDVMPVGSWERVCRLLVQILDALAYAHARGVIHRDLKPENFLLFDTGDEASEWRVKLADFGIAHAFGREQQVDTTELEVAAGTPLYMAPEQLHGRWREFGPWTDLYALGCIAWEFVCGRPPFQGESAFEIATQHESEPPPRLEPRVPVPDELEGWIHRAMAADPERRFRRAADAAWALPRGVLAQGGSPERDDAEEATSPEPTDEYTAETQLEALTATISLDETPDDETSPVLEEAPTRSASSEGGDQLERAETAAAVDGEVGPESGDRPDGAGRSLWTFHPPLPSDWRPEHTDPIPAPLVGAGLGLFGLREPPFVDRREACDRIWDALKRVTERGVYESVFVAGGAGTGKSRLAEWMATRSHEVGAAQIVRAVHTSSGGASEGLRGALDRRLRTVRMDRGRVYEHLTRLLPALSARDDELVEEDTRALTEYLRPTDEEDEEVDGPRYRFSNLRHKQTLLVRTLDRLADRRPVILWLDDLQWGTEALGVLEYLEERRSDPPAMMVLATVRSDIVAERPALTERLETLRAGEGARHLHLTPLSREHQRDLLNGLLPLEDGLADRLADRTEGHPLFAMQLMGHWIDGGALAVGSEGFALAEGDNLALPEDIHHLWIERIDRLLELFGSDADPVLEALELAAALGRQVDREQWHQLLEDGGRARPDGLVARLVERGLAERTADGWAFAHGLLVDSLARRAREQNRWQDHHRRCARMLEPGLTGEELGPRERIAEHWVEGGRPERALKPLHEESLLCLRHGDDKKHFAILERCDELLDRLDLPDDDPKRLEQRIFRARITRREDHIEQARRELEAIWDELDEAPPRLEALCAQVLSLTISQAGDLQTARQWAERALEASRRADMPRREAWLHNKLAWDWWHDGKLDRAERHVDRAIESAERADSLWHELNGLRTRAQIRHARGADSDRQLLETVRKESAGAGYVDLEALALNSLGEQARFGGRLEEARRYYRRYLKMIRQFPRPGLETMAHLNLGQVALGAGNLEETAAQLGELQDILETMGARSKEGMVHLLRLGYAAGIADRARFAKFWEPLGDGWPEDWRLVRDHPWMLETIGEYVEEAGWEEARQVWGLAADLWEELGDAEAAERVKETVVGSKS
jgi:serine/threonine protein kinase/tetratricopeptide (TPR) repeat protein